MRFTTRSAVQETFRPFSSEAELRQTLADFGLTASHVDSVLESLANKGDFIKLSVDGDKIAARNNA